MSLSPPYPSVPSSPPPRRAGRRSPRSATRRGRRRAARRRRPAWFSRAARCPPARTPQPGTGSTASAATTAWHDGTFALDPDGVVSRDDIVLGQPNINPTASIPLGNGALGVAAWAANGFTAQLNRSDTMPDRKSPGQVNIPGLSVISHASDFSGRLDLTDGVLEESGGGESMKAWVSSAKDELIVDVSGANPNVAQTASIYLWSGRNPTAAVSGTVGSLAETWVDNSEAGAERADVRVAVRDHRGRPGRAGQRHQPDARCRSASSRTRTATSGSSWPRPRGTASSALTAAQTVTKLIGQDASVPERNLLGSQDRWWRQLLVALRAGGNELRRRQCRLHREPADPLPV